MFFQCPDTYVSAKSVIPVIKSVIRIIPEDVLVTS